MRKLGTIVWLKRHMCDKLFPLLAFVCWISASQSSTPSSVVPELNALLEQKDLETTMRLLDSHWHDLLNHHLREIHPFIERFHAEARESGNAKYEVYALISLGEVQLRMNDFEKAEALLLEGENMARDEDVKELLPIALGTLGNLTSSLGEHERSARYYLEAIELFRPLNNPVKVNRLLFNVGAVFFRLGDMHRAYDYFERAHEEAVVLGDTGLMINTLSGFGAVEQSLGKYDSAEYHLTEAFNLETTWMASNGLEKLVNLAVVSISKKEYALAKQRLHGAINAPVNELKADFVTAAWKHLGEVHALEGDLDSAEFCYRRALSQADEFGLKHQKIDILKGLSEVLEEKGELAGSLELLKAGQELEQEVRGSDVWGEVTSLEKTWEQGQAQAEKESIPVKLYLVAGGVSLLLLIAGGWWGFVMNRRQRIKSTPEAGHVASDGGGGSASNGPEERKSQPLQDTDSDLLWKRLSQLMESRKCYLDPDLTLQHLSTELDTSRNNLSYVINERSGGNFRNYVNGFRVQEALELLKNRADAQFSLEGIGNQAGFKSKSTFYAAFKRVTGCTPLEYLHSIGTRADAA